MSNEKKTMLTQWIATEQKWAIRDNPDDPYSAASIFLPTAPLIAASIERLREEIRASTTWQKYSVRNSGNLRAVVGGNTPQTKTSPREAGCIPEILSNVSSFITLMLATGIISFFIQKISTPHRISSENLTSCFFNSSPITNNTFPITNSSLSNLAYCLNNNLNFDNASNFRTAMLVVIITTAIFTFVMNSAKRLAIDEEKQEKEAYQLMLATMKNLSAIQKELDLKHKVISKLIAFLGFNETLLKEKIISSDDYTIKDFLISSIEKNPVLKLTKK